MIYDQIFQNTTDATNLRFIPSHVVYVIVRNIIFNLHFQNLRFIPSPVIFHQYLLINFVLH